MRYNYAYLPVFSEKKSATPAIIKHVMKVVKVAINILNQDQVPTTSFDQPLFALSQVFFQWNWPIRKGWEGACCNVWWFDSITMSIQNAVRE